MNELSDHERIRRLLDEAVADVEPRSALQEIRSRTATGTRRRGWAWAAGAVVAATAASIAAVVTIGGNPGTTGATSSGPAAQGQAAWSVYFLGDTGRGPRLYRELHNAGGSARVDVLQQALDGDADDPDYRSAWPEGTTVSAVQVAEDSPGSMVTVDLTGPPLTGRPAGVSAQEAQASVQQALWTLQELVPPRSRVAFTVDGSSVATLLGVPVDRPMAGAAEDALAQVWIDEPAEGALVRSGFEVSGLANAFEANVQWELRKGDAVTKSGFTTAKECCTMAPYSFTVKAPPGEYTLVVHDSDPSDGEGFAPWRDTKTVTITG